jgi:hypothetical protein
MSGSWRVEHAVAVLTKDGKLRGTVVKRSDKFVAHSVEGELGVFAAAADAVAAITGRNLAEELARVAR